METSASRITLVVEGVANRAETPAFSPEVLAITGTPRLVTAFDLQPSMRGEIVPELVDVKLDDLMELRLEGDMRLLMSVADYQAQFSERTSRGPQDAGRVRVPALLPAKSSERGILKYIVKGLKIIGIDLADMAAKRLAAAIDNKKKETGLYRCSLASPTLALSEEVPKKGGDKPLLVFIHGTMSSTEGSFGGIWSDCSDVRLRLAEYYEERCYAFEHKTLTESPVTNALALAKVLPADSVLHLVSHSRGGMIGELLCRASRLPEKGEAGDPFIDADFKLFASPVELATQNDLRELGKELTEKRVRVERFVRVACPARGTTMASGRLDRYLSVLNMGLSPLVHLDWVKDIAWFVAAVVKERTDPTVMPGLEAMMPGSATVKLLNRQDVVVDADLRVLAGDYDGGGIMATVADWAFDGFYGSENDIVVNTPSMYGGARRKESRAPLYFHDRGAQAYHFNYFKNPLSAKRLADGLLQEDPSSAGFRPLAHAPHKDDPIARGVAIELMNEDRGEPLERKALSGDGTKPVLVLVPGIMGTHLKKGDSRIWLGIKAMWEGGFSDLGTGAGVAASITTHGVMKMSYQEFAQFISATHEVLYFPYDWRMSLKEAGAEFAKFMADTLPVAAINKRPVRIMAHSMGGLLVRMAAVLSIKKEKSDWWECFRSGPGNRFIMAGTPNNGSWTVPYVLSGRDPIIGIIKTLDWKNSEKEILNIAAGFQGFLEMLPCDERHTCFDHATWQGWLAADGNRWGVPAAATLEECRANRRYLDEFDFAREKDVVRYVAGCAESTPSGVKTDSGNLFFTSSSLGDGRVLWSTGIPQGVKTWYMDAVHGDLLKCKKAFKALAEIIGTGETTLLSDKQPSLRGDIVKEGVMAERPVPYYPDETMLLQAVMGGSIVPKRQEAVSRCFRVTVCHGDLSAAKYPVAVGHYVGDTINGTEAALDRRLSGLLSQRHKLGVYPGPEGTGDVFVRENGGKSSTAIVVGLGQVGDLTTARLASGFASSVLKFATSPAAQKPSSKDESGFSISAILIGSGAGWGLGVKESVRALIEGACRANDMLAELDPESTYLAELEILEVFEDRALAALRAVRNFAVHGHLANIEYSEQIRHGKGGRSRAIIEEGSDWWQRVKVEVNEDREMKFTTLTDLARIEETLLPTQRMPVDRLMEYAVKEPSVPEEAMVAIYNLLTPNVLKERAPDQGDVLMLLNAEAAHYPWEMMYVGVEGKRIPLALRNGLIRQLSVPQFRPRPVRASQPRALVIADPKLPGDGTLRMLPGATKEGISVVTTLRDRGGYQVNDQINSGVLDIFSALFANEYRILHLAGHGVYNHALKSSGSGSAKQRAITGMVLDWPSQRGAEKTRSA